MSNPNTIKPANVSPVATDGEQAERDELLQDVLDSYIRKGPHFHHKAAPDLVVFTDDGNQLSTQFDNRDVVEAMLKVADSRGWEPVVVSGNDGFYNTAEVILENPRIQNVIEQAERENKAVLEESDRRSKPERLEPANDQAKADDADLSTIAANVKTGQHGDREADLNDALKARREAALKKVSDQYRVAGARYYFKDHSGNVNVLAFKDAGTKLTTTLNSERVSLSLVDMAQAKGWDAIKVSGHSEFRRQVWREATERGLEVRGYKPTERDLAGLKPVNENAVEKGALPEKVESRSPTRAQVTGKAPGMNSGRLVSFGSAPYQHRKDADASYQVTIESGGKERTVWGLDLDRAIGDSGVSVGDSITLTHEGRKPVSIQVDEKDKSGVVIGTRTIQTHRNSWSIEQQNKATVIEAVGRAVVASKVANPEDRRRIEEGIAARIDAHQGPLPTVPMHDNARVDAPSRESKKEKAPELIR